MGEAKMFGDKIWTRMAVGGRDEFVQALVPFPNGSIQPGVPAAVPEDVTSMDANQEQAPPSSYEQLLEARARQLPPPEPQRPDNGLER